MARRRAKGSSAVFTAQLLASKGKAEHEEEQRSLSRAKWGVRLIRKRGGANKDQPQDRRRDSAYRERRQIGKAGKRHRERNMWGA